VAASLENFRRRPSVSFSDNLIVEIARKSGHVPVGTFDRDLAKLDGTPTRVDVPAFALAGNLRRQQPV